MRSIDETVGLSAVPKFCTTVSVASIALAMGECHKCFTWWLAEWHAHVVQRHSELGSAGWKCCAWPCEMFFYHTVPAIQYPEPWTLIRVTVHHTF